ncbi:unnamed protein product [Caenorhabditis auriculariae]|uniref:Uncharacterized protein n=1 Tax=Caenorhabditis auriculariae TaxID=2777116 RepID=A0A8S1HJ52_9PELO|nr:unnamed protein product [Caenorhabditis auriculariae]
MLYFLLASYLNASTSQYHRNMQLLYTVYLAMYQIHATSRLIQLLANFKYEYELETRFPDLLIVTSYIRLFIASIAFTIIMGFIFERACATYYIGVYEATRHAWIFRLICVLLVLNGAASTILFHQGKDTVKLNALIFMLLGNFCDDYRKHGHRADQSQIFSRMSRRKIGKSCEYSLAQRYQISENIRTCRTFSQIFKCIILSNVTCIVALACDVFVSTPRLRNLTASLYNVASLFYIYSMPTVTVINSPLWQQKLVWLIKKLHCWSLSSVEPSRQIASTFGQNLLFEQTKHTDHYFGMLKEAWSQQIPNRHKNFSSSKQF